MNKKLQVFISSTFTDLREERQAAVEAILLARHIPAGMELFTAGDESQMKTIKAWIDESDVFMLILGGRYGSIEQKTGRSYTHLEYEYAVKQKKRLFAVVIQPEALEAKVRAQGPSAMETENAGKLKDLKKLVTSKMCEFFTDTKDLKLAVVKALSEISRDPDLPGWVKGTDVVDPKGLIEEADRLRSENTMLAKSVSEFQAVPDPREFAGATLAEVAKALMSQKVNVDQVKMSDSFYKSIHNRGILLYEIPLLWLMCQCADQFSIGVSTEITNTAQPRTLGIAVNDCIPLLTLYELIEARPGQYDAGFRLSTSGRRFVNMVKPQLAKFDRRFE